MLEMVLPTNHLIDTGKTEQTTPTVNNKDLTTVEEKTTNINAN